MEARKQAYCKPFTVIILAGLILGLITTTGCYKPRPDRLQGNLGYEQLHKQLVKEQQELQKTRDMGISEIEGNNTVQKELPIEPIAPTYNPLDEVPVSISVQNEPLHNVLYVIARNAGLNLIIDPKISLENRITVSFEETPSSLVMEKLLEAYDLAWKVKGNILQVMQFEDQIFDLEFMNSDSNGELSTASSIADTGATGGFNVTGAVNTKYDEGLYGDLIDNLNNIIDEKSPTAEDSDSDDSDDEDDEDSTDYGYFTIDPSAGTLFVHTTPSKMKAIATVVNKLRKRMSLQVVIDAQIMEVQLSDGFNLGIDWNFVQQRLIQGGAAVYGLGVNAGSFGTPQLNGNSQGIVIGPTNYTSPMSYTIDATTGEKIYSEVASAGLDSTFSATIKALQEFGGVTAVSNPHVRARHNQPAVVTSGTTTDYIAELQRERIVEDSGEVTTNYTTTTGSAFSGVTLGVIPFFHEGNSIDLKIYPMLTESDLRNKQTVGTGTESETSITLPSTKIRNINTAVRVHDGDTIVLGGLIYKNGNKSDSQTPGLGSIPGLGWLFKQRSDSETLTELVIIMKIRVAK
jgi:MSHA type pilus biogenesis protein MshL